MLLLSKPSQFRGFCISVNSKYSASEPMGGMRITLEEAFYAKEEFSLWHHLDLQEHLVYSTSTSGLSTPALFAEPSMGLT